MNAKQMAAISYIKRGWVVHPLIAPESKAASPGKRPILRGWQKRTIESEVKLKWFENGNNVGLVSGAASGLTVIDFDSEEHLPGLVEGLELNTLQSVRTEGRRHMYFAYNPRLRNCKYKKFGIEVLNTGANVVMPPSVHMAGDDYVWVDPDAPVMEMPKEFEDRLAELLDGVLVEKE